MVGIASKTAGIATKMVGIATKIVGITAKIVCITYKMVVIATKTGWYCYQNTVGAQNHYTYSIQYLWWSAPGWGRWFGKPAR